MSPTIRFHVTGFGESLSEAHQTDFYIKRHRRNKGGHYGEVLWLNAAILSKCVLVAAQRLMRFQRLQISRPKISYSTVVHLDEIALGEGEQKVKGIYPGQVPLQLW